MRLPVVLVACAAALLASAATTESFAQPKKAPPPPARSDPRTAEAKKLFDDGAAAYAKGSYEEAIHAWEKAFELSQKPLIFESIANAWERLGDARKARDNLAKWRDSAPPEERDLLDARIKNLEARVQREDEAARKVAADQAAAERARVDAEANKSKPWVPGAVLLGGGGVLAIAGVVLDVVAASKRPPAGSCKASTGGQTFCLASAQDAVGISNKLAIAGDVLWIAGAAAAAGGAVLIIVRRPAPRADAALPAPPATAWLAPAAGGFVLGGTF
jgi:tetratricopeptide (TPR) repeat protein